MLSLSTTTFRFVIAAATAVAILGFAGHSADARSSPTRAQDYFNNITTTLDAQQKDLANVTKVANAAADVYIQDGESIGAAGDAMFVWELCDRAGGLRQIEPDAPAGTLMKAPWKGIVLYGLPDKPTTTAQADLLALHANGDKVIVFGNRARLNELALESMHRTGVGADWEVDNHAAPGLVLISGRLIQLQPSVPTNGVANMAAGWEFCAEFVGALTRRGRMPSMWESIFMPSATARDASLDKVKFYPDAPTPIAEGKLGTDYIDQLRKHIADLDGVELPHIEALAADVKAAHAAGGTAYYFGDGHADPHALDQDGVPTGVFVSGMLDTPHIQIKANDVVLFLAYNARYASPAWQRVADDAHAIGAKVVYSFTDYNQAEVDAIPKGDLYINQHWGAGDAEVTIKGYDVKVFPVSGVLEDMILYMAMAEVVGNGA